MSDIKRYSFYDEPSPDGYGYEAGMLEDETGDYVRFEDHAAALRTRDERVRVLEGQNGKLREALNKCRERFRQYGDMHEAKGNDEKANSNYLMADLCLNALGGESAFDSTTEATTEVTPDRCDASTAQDGNLVPVRTADACRVCGNIKYHNPECEVVRQLHATPTRPTMEEALEVLRWLVHETAWCDVVESSSIDSALTRLGYKWER